MSTHPAQTPRTLEQALAEILRLRAEVGRLEQDLARLKRESQDALRREFDAALSGFPSERRHAAPPSPALTAASPGGADATPGPPVGSTPPGLPADLDELRAAIVQVRAEREQSEAVLQALLGPEPRPRSARAAPEPVVPTAPQSTPDGPPAPRVEISLSPGTPRATSGGTVRVVAGAALVMAAALVGYVGWYRQAPVPLESPAAVGAASLVQPSGDSAAAGPPAPDPAAEVLPPAADAPPAAAPEAAPTPDGLELRIAATRQVWLRVVVDGQRVFERTAVEGDVLTFRATSALVIRAGDAGAVRIAMDGRDVGTLGRDGEVLTRRFSADSRATPARR